MSFKLSQYMVNSRRIASIYEWKQRFGGAIMSVNVQSTNNHIDLAITSPSSLDNITSLESLELKKKEVSKLEYLVHKHSICAFVIGWPLTEDGRMGASCGKVLYFLDTLLRSQNHVLLLSKDRPFTLYNKSINTTTTPTNCFNQPENNYTPNHTTNTTTNKAINRTVPDEWGRSVCFSQDSSNYSNEPCAFSSCTDGLKNTTSAASLLEQFIDDHWQLNNQNNDLNSIPQRRGFKKQLYEVLSIQNTPQSSIDRLESDHVYLSSALL